MNLNSSFVFIFIAATVKNSVSVVELNNIINLNSSFMLFLLIVFVNLSAESPHSLILSVSPIIIVVDYYWLALNGLILSNSANLML